MALGWVPEVPMKSSSSGMPIIAEPACSKNTSHQRHVSPNCCLWRIEVPQLSTPLNLPTPRSDTSTGKSWTACETNQASSQDHKTISWCVHHDFSACEKSLVFLCVWWNTFMKQSILLEEIRLTTWDVWKPVNNGDIYHINWLAGFLNHQQYF